MTRRILAIWLPALAIERWRQAGGPAGPAALTEAQARGIALSATTPEAHDLGIVPGMKLTDARAIFPGLRLAPHDRSGDTARLARLADGMERFTPWVAVDGKDGLLLDVSGCAHLHGGEAGLARAIAQALARAGHAAQIGLAGTIGAAWAMARFSPGISSAGNEREAMAPLPVASLRLASETVRRLRELGLKQVGQLMEIDRGSLARRFPHEAAGVLPRLDQALGKIPEPLTPRHPAPEYRVRISPMSPVIDLDGVIASFESLLESLLESLETDRRGVRQLTFSAFRCDGLIIRHTVGLARAGREAAHIRRLFAEHLPGIDPDHGIDTLMLSADRTEPLAPEQSRLASLGAAPPKDDGSEITRLLDRLRNRLGSVAVGQMAPVSSHLPERAVRRTEGCTGVSWPTLPDQSPRPLTLLETPEPVAVVAEIPEGPPLTFRWRRALYRTARATGPERIAPEWWRDAPKQNRTRDYYMIEDSNGRRYWLYRDGLYREQATHGTPTWYLHGLFA